MGFRARASPVPSLGRAAWVRDGGLVGFGLVSP